MENFHVKQEYLSYSPEQTTACAIHYAKLILSHSQPSLITLQGLIGVGKTVFVKGLAQGLCIDEAIQSPTFPILLEYNSGQVPLYHFDLYRLGSPEEFYLLGGDEILAGGGTYGSGICVIEWAERLETYPPIPHYNINISMQQKNSTDQILQVNTRLIQVERNT